MAEILKSMILGVIEGITEWLPISSTGHLILAEEFIALDMDKSFTDMFNVVIQLGAILAVVIIYWNKLWPFSSNKAQHFVKPKSINMWLKIAVGLIPLVIFVLIPKLLFSFDISDWMDEKLYNGYVVAATLIIYGILFIIIENLNKNKTPSIYTVKDISYKTAFLIGVFQILAVVPGTSRSGATILGAIILGCSRTIAAEYSFFMAVPVMMGASLLKVYEYVKAIAVSTTMGFSDQAMQLVLLGTGMVVSFIVSIVAIKLFIGYLKKKDFKAFGYYRIALGVIVLAYFAIFA